MPNRSRKLLISVFVALIGVAITFGTTRRQIPGFKTGDVSVLWVARAWGSEYDAKEILAQFPNLKTVYVPIFQFYPKPVPSPGESRPLFLQKLKADCDLFRMRGVRVFGVFAPLEIQNDSPVPPGLKELSLTQAFAQKPTSITLTTVGDKAAVQYESWLTQCLSKEDLDGVAIDMLQPTDRLCNYSLASREYFVKKYHFDPVDIDYPLGTPKGLSLRDQQLVDLLVTDRLDEMKSFLARASSVCRQKGKLFEVYSSAVSYGYPAATRAANLADWGRWLLEDPNMHVVLGMSDLGQSDPESCRQGLQTARELKIDPSRITFLIRSGLAFEMLASDRDFDPKQAGKSRLALLYQRSRQ